MQGSSRNRKAGCGSHFGFLSVQRWEIIDLIVEAVFLGCSATHISRVAVKLAAVDIRDLGRDVVMVDSFRVIPGGT